LEERRPLVPLVDVLVHRVAEEGSPELRRRAAPPCCAARRRRRVRAVRAALDQSATSRSTSRCKPRTKSSPLARTRGTPARPPPLAPVRRRPRACVRPEPSDRDPTISVALTRVSSQLLLPAIRSRSNESYQVDPGQYRSNRQDLAFLQKTP
jgi:hypothetical protein